MARKPKDTVQLKLRFPEYHRRWLEREAQRHGRSMNAEIVDLIGRAHDQSDKAGELARRLVDQFSTEIFDALHKKVQEEAQKTSAAPVKAVVAVGSKSEDPKLVPSVSTPLSLGGTSTQRTDETLASEATRKIIEVSPGLGKIIEPLVALKKREGSLPKGFGKLIEMLVEDFEAREAAQGGEKAKTAPVTMPPSGPPLHRWTTKDDGEKK
jgi:hypothetical protein